MTPPRGGLRRRFDGECLAAFLALAAIGACEVGARPVCPAAPDTGDVCATDGLRCTSGDAVRPECRRAWTCSGGRFVDTTAACAPAPAGFCPSAPPANGGCGSDGSVCDFADGTICVCARCFGQLCRTDAIWLCAPPPPAPCPAAAPNDGSACASDGAQCPYGEECAGSGATAACAGGAWRWERVLCPT